MGFIQLSPALQGNNLIPWVLHNTPHTSLGLVALHVLILVQHQDIFHIVLILTLLHVKLFRKHLNLNLPNRNFN